MRVLIPVTFLPYPPSTGARIRTWELARRLAAHHEVTFALHLRSPADRLIVQKIRHSGFKVLCGPVNTGLRAAAHLFQEIAHGGFPVSGLRRSQPLEAQLAEIQASHPFDVIQVEHADMARYPFLLPSRSETICSIMLHDMLSESYKRIARIETGIFSRAWRRFNAARLPHFERSILPRYDLCFTVSERDRRTLETFVPAERIAVLPNSIDPVTNSLLPEPNNAAPIFLLVGYMLYPPNADAARWFLRDIFPRIQNVYPAARLFLVGGDPPRDLIALARRAGPQVVLTGNVPDLAPYYRKADVAFAPLRAGGGTRLKILEAMARGRPVVSTTLGAEGLDVRHGEHLLIADTPQEIADAGIALFSQHALREEIRRNARALVESKYSWDACADRQLMAYEDLAQRKARARQVR